MSPEPTEAADDGQPAHAHVQENDATIGTMGTVDDEHGTEPRAARSDRRAPRARPDGSMRDDGDAGLDFAAPPRPRRTRRQRRAHARRRALAVLVLAVLVVGLIVVGARALSGSDTSTAQAKQTVAGAATTTTETAPATTAKASGSGSGAKAASQPTKVSSLPAPTYQRGSTALGNLPGLAAASFVALDVDRNQIVLAYNERDKRPIASLTKMMTGLLTAEAGNLGHLVTVSSTANGVEPNVDNLITGHRYPRGILLYSAMLGSNNNAAAALGEDLGRGSYARFYRMMNRRARELGMKDTRYGSSSGLNDATNWSSARDQAIVLSRALTNPVFARAVGTWHHYVRWPDDGKTKLYENHNKMLQTYPGTIGGKTGFTTLASGCLAVAVRRGGHTIIGVVLHSNDIWGDMPRLINAAFKRSP